MCGIVGFVSGGKQVDRYDRVKVLTQALFADTLRGHGGTGVATVSKENEINVFKKGLSAPDYLQTTVGELALKSAEDAVVVIGHNRAATIGSVSDKNSHPFYFGGKQDIVMVHNGTLNSYYQLSPKDFTHSVDSAHVAMALAQTDDELSVLKKLKGSFVLVWYNRTKKTFNVARNENRDIWYKMSEDGSLYYASEMLMLDWILVRNSIKMKDRQYKNFSQDCWYEWKLGDDWKIGKPTTRKIVFEKEDKGTYYRTGGYGGYDNYPLWQDDGGADDYGAWRSSQGKGASRSHNGSSWRDSGDSATASILEKFKLRKKDLVFVDIDCFDPYAKGERGCLVGEIVGWYQNEEIPDGMEMTIHGIERSVWSKIVSERMRYYLPCRVDTYTGYSSNAGEKTIRLVGGIDWHEYNMMTGDPEKYLIERQANIDELAVAALKKEKPKEEGEDLVAGPGGVLIPRSFWDELAQGGCLWCDNPVEPRDFGDIKWASSPAAGSESAPLCHQCSASEQVTSELKQLAIYIPTKESA